MGESNISFNNKLTFLSYINKLNENDFQKLVTLIKLIKEKYSDLTIAIKTPNPITDKRWGDYFFAVSLKKSFEKKGFNVIIHERENWAEDNSDIVIVLRGVIDYDTKEHHLNLMWNISHPNDIPLEEYEKYDIVFVASNSYSQYLNNNVKTLVHPLLQCTDPDKFKPQINHDFDEDILFVGIARENIFRKIIRDMLETSHDFSVYGLGWENFIDSKYIKGQFIDNNILNKAYSNCKILLNDHWDDMADKDFISNRIFDALACKTFVISDDVNSIHNLFNGNVVTYNNPQELDEKLSYYLTHDYERETMANNGYQIVLKNHTFDNRVSEILDIIKNKYYLKFISQFDLIKNQTLYSESSDLNYFSDLTNDFWGHDYSELRYQNRVMNIEIAKLKEKIYFLEQEKLFLGEKNKKSDKFKKLFNLIKLN